MVKLSPEIRWHIAYREERNEMEAYYIYSLVKFFSEKFGESYKSLLEVGCGNGRLHPFLRKFGLDVSGLDNNKELLQKAKKRNRGFEKNYFFGDMRRFKLKRKFDIILSWFTSFGYYDDRINLKILGNFSFHLRKGGLLILDIPNAHGRIVELHPAFVLEYDNILEICRNSIKKINNQTFWELDMNFYKKEKNNLILMKRVKQPVRLYTSEDISKMLKKSRLEVINVFESMTFRPIKPASPQMTLVCRKS